MGLEILSGEAKDDFEATEDQDVDKGETLGDVVEFENAEDECAPKRNAPDPGRPSKEEVEAHRVDHLPYRSWCEHCVQGRGTGDQHRSKGQGNVPVISVGYLLVAKSGVKPERDMTADDGDVFVRILVIKDPLSKATIAHVVRAKGVDEEGYVVEKLHKDMLWPSYARIVMRCDNEPVIF